MASKRNEINLKLIAALQHGPLIAKEEPQNFYRFDCFTRGNIYNVFSDSMFLILKILIPYSKFHDITKICNVK